MAEVAIKVRGGRQGKNKEKAERLRRSAFLYTVSTNQRYKDDDPNLENDEEVFEETIRSVVDNLGKYVNVMESHKKWDNATIADVDVEYGVERGPTGQLHAHILVRIKHRTKVQLAYDRIKAKICDDLGLDNVYTNSKLLGHGAWGADFLESYVHKMNERRY